MRNPNEDRVFRGLVEEHAGLVSRIASTYESRADVADELVQDVFLAIWRALDRFRAESSMKTFIARIAHNVCISHVRKAVRTKTSPLEDEHVDDSPSPDEQAQKLRNRDRLLAAIRRMALPDRQLVSLHLEGFSNREVAESLDQTEGNVAVRLTRLRAALKAELGGGL